jgi:hypothetical protein
VTTDRETILSAVRAARPPVVAYPDIVSTPGFEVASGDLVSRFEAAARTAAADVMHSTRAELERLVTEWRGFACEAEFGVAENGSVWLRGSRLGDRSALFLATQVLVVLPKSTIVADVHAAYTLIDMTDEEFGVFVAGPSKTADIEQSLVIGAHGAKELTIVLI